MRWRPFQQRLLNDRFPSRAFQMSRHICFIILIGMLSSSCVGGVFIGRTWDEPTDWMVGGSVGGVLPVPSDLSGNLAGRPMFEVEVGRIPSVNGALVLPPPFSDSELLVRWSGFTRWASYVIGGAGVIDERKLTPNSGFGIVVTLKVTELDGLFIRSDYRYFFSDESPFNRVYLGVEYYVFPPS